jgi:hypothetical protein
MEYVRCKGYSHGIKNVKNSQDQKPGGAARPIVASADAKEKPSFG